MPTFFGTGDNETIDGGALADSIFGRGGNDLLRRFGGADRIDGEAGNDVIEGDDTLLGGGEDDTNDGNDTQDGRAGADRLFGESGNDSLVGGAGADQLDGGSEDDTLDGGAGNNTMAGGAGDDTFRFESRTGSDRIDDFSVTNDKIQIAVAGVDDFDDLRFSSDLDGNAVIAWGPLAGASSVVLVGVSVGALSTDDFSFG